LIVIPITDGLFFHGKYHNMTFHDYLSKNLSNTVMITVAFDDKEPVQYNHWNWFHQIGQLHLLNDDYTLGHVLHSGSITENSDGSITYTSNHVPKKCVMNFYFGGVTK